MVHHVVFGGVCEDDGGGDGAEEVDRFFDGGFVEDDKEIAFVEAVVSCVDDGSGGAAFFGTDGGDVVWGFGHGAAVAGRGGGDVDFVAE